MLKDYASSAIGDLARARLFYSDTLGLELDGEGQEEEVLTYRTGATRLVAYPSDEAGTNRANAVVWGVGDDIEAIVTGLAAKGVAFEKYPDLGDYRDGIHHVGGMKLV